MSLWPAGCNGLKLWTYLSVMLISLWVTSGFAQRLPLVMDIPAFLLDELQRPPEINELIWAEGRDYEVAENWELAAKSWDLAVKETPSFDLLRLRACARYLQVSDVENAKRLLLQSSGTDPKIKAAQIHLFAVCLWLERDDRGAWRELMTLVQRKEAFPASYHLLARIGIIQNQPSEAIGWLRHTLVRIPKPLRKDVARHPVFDPISDDAAYAKMMREVGAFDRTEDGEVNQEPLPPHLKTGLNVQTFDFRDLRTSETRSIEEGGLFFQGLHLEGTPDPKT